MRKNTPLDEFSSKLKKLYIEIHDYSYFHSPSEADQMDNRFIGRKKLIERFKSILINCETKTGAYLITGYRGVGKSSFVSKVLNEITDGNKINSTLTFFSLLGFVTFFLKYLILKLNIHLFGEKTTFPYIIPLVLEIALFWFLFLTSESSTELSILKSMKNAVSKPSEIWKLLKFFFWNCFVRYKSGTINKRLKRFQQFVLMVCTIYLTGYFFRLLFQDNSDFRFDLSIFILLILINMVDSRIEKIDKLLYEKESRLKSEKFKRILHEIFLAPIKKYVNFSHRSYIKLNLGYDDIKEEDVFRLIVLNMKSQFSRNIYTFRRYYLIRLSGFILLYLSTFNLFYDLKKDKNPSSINHVKEFFQFAKVSLSLTFFFPSQDSLFLEIDSANSKELLALIKVNFEKFDFLPDKQISITTEGGYSLTQNITRTNIDTIKKTDSTLTKSWIQQPIYRAILKPTILFVNYVDFTINYIYSKARDFLFKKILQSNGSSSFAKTVIPYHIDYALVGFVFTLIYLLTLLNRLFGIRTSKDIFKRIKALNDLIDAQIIQERIKDGSVSTKPVNLKRIYRKEKRSYPLGPREIEKELIDILDDLDKIPPFYYRPEFIFVFDELDKVEPYEQRIGVDGKLEGRSHNLMYSAESSRIRQQTILKFLSNMKYFLTSAKAKFIFIAGREMYDASLADVSDRSFYVGSIFHDIIYVDSFLSDDTNGKFSDITSTIEEYVCQFIISKEYKYQNNLVHPSLRDFNAYLIKEFDEFNELATDSRLLKLIARQKREKIVFHFERFIVFLTHLSNGSPKKVTKLFESFIQTKEYNQLRKDNYLVVHKYPNNSSFLVFDFFDHYRIGMTSYLANPIMLSITNTSKGYSDKLLVSAGFIIDHLFKFHKTAFSWRHIEIAPDIVDIHRTIELRNFISETIDYLTKSHLQEIDTGIYQFKFNKRISNEIAFLSKISEEASASFNFTLDESLTIKEFYRKQLDKLSEKYKDYNIKSVDSDGDGNADAEIIHSISHIHMILGDLYFYDEDYNQAITEYMDAIQRHRHLMANKLTADQMVLLIRNMLKLGFAFEKRKSYSSALLTFGQLVNVLVRFRNIELSNIGLTENTLVKKEGDNYFLHREAASYTVDDSSNKKILDFDLSDPKNEENKNELVKKLINDYIIPETEDFITKLSAFEGIRLIYTPMLAKLFLIEKTHLGGISMIDLSRVDKEFNFLTKTLFKEQKYALISDFHTNLGDILFYKNGALNSNSYVEGDKIFVDLCKNCSSFKNSKYDSSYILKNEDFCKDRRDNTKVKQLEIPCFACYFYKLSYLNLLEALIPERIEKIANEQTLSDEEKQRIDNEVGNNDELKKIKTIEQKKSKLKDSQYLKEIITDILDEKSSINSHRYNSYKLIARNLSNIGDTYLSCSIVKNEKDLIPSMFELLYFDNLLGLMNSFITVFNSNQVSIPKIISFKDKHSHSDLIIYYYFASYLAFKRANEHKAASFQLVKILYYLKSFFNVLLESKYNLTSYKKQFESLEQNNQLINIIKEGLVSKAIAALYTAYDNVHIAEINKNKAIFTENNSDLLNRISLRKVSLNVDVDEINIIYQEVKIKLLSLSQFGIFEKHLENNFLKVYFKNLCSPYILNQSIYNRIIRLNFKGKLNFHLFKILVSDATYWNTEFDQFSFYTMILERWTKDDCFREFALQDEHNTNDINEMYHELSGLNWIQWVEFLISDSIKCYTEILNHISTYSSSFMVTHSGIAAFHEKLFEWCSYYRLYLQFGHFCNDALKNSINFSSFFDHYFEGTMKELERNYSEKFPSIELHSLQYKDICNENLNYNNGIKILDLVNLIFDKKKSSMNISLKLADLIEEDNLRFIDPSYQIKEAIRHYYSTQETHSEGKAYKKLLDKMYLLNDDLNDRLYFFTIANERFLLNNGIIKEKQRRLKDEFPHNKIFDTDSYMKTVIGE